MGIHKTSTRLICKLFTPTAISKWENTYDNIIDWQDMFKLPYASTQETQLQALKYRIIHRYLPCKKWLCDLSFLNSNWCDTCKILDITGHYIYSYTSAKLFWSKLEKWWNTVSSCLVSSLVWKTCEIQYILWFNNTFVFVDELCHTSW